MLTPRAWPPASAGTPVGPAVGVLSAPGSAGWRQGGAAQPCASGAPKTPGPRADAEGRRADLGSGRSGASTPQAGPQGASQRPVLRRVPPLPRAPLSARGAPVTEVSTDEVFVLSRAARRLAEESEDLWRCARRTKDWGSSDSAGNQPPKVSAAAWERLQKSMEALEGGSAELRRMLGGVNLRPAAGWMSPDVPQNVAAEIGGSNVRPAAARLGCSSPESSPTGPATPRGTQVPRTLLESALQAIDASAAFQRSAAPEVLCHGALIKARWKDAFQGGAVQGGHFEKQTSATTLRDVVAASPRQVARVECSPELRPGAARIPTTPRTEPRNWRQTSAPTLSTPRGTPVGAGGDAKTCPSPLSGVFTEAEARQVHRVFHEALAFSGVEPGTASAAGPLARATVVRQVRKCLANDNNLWAQEDTAKASGRRDDYIALAGLVWQLVGSGAGGPQRGAEGGG